jgi:hypothetical protein
MAYLNVELEPRDAARDALWFEAISWQGLDWNRGQSPLVDLEEVSDGVYRSPRPLPVSGQWKTLIRLQVDNDVVAVPVYMPADPAIPAEEVPAESSFTRSFVRDKEILQREAITDDVGLQRVGYGILVLIGLLWIASVAWALARIDSISSRGRAAAIRTEGVSRADQLSA